ncbi:hypothetical protein CI109_100172 [Kwoniella shandongensis]|uniref:Uncharacterized protein n=1 Tax=Kwoniella shandongensis TaxID=1734106 RepID=A0A5M6BV13_9TREE|nr:uncharacterized protein CI109_005772 [Kwoniella shandongensis]KAA5525890.1 hypothetical protein CI109_005772 [Kwoniella shandongensis]
MPPFTHQLIAGHHVIRAETGGTPTASTPSTTHSAGLSASDLIEEAQDHWNVSAGSILAAWGATAIGSLLIILLYSSLRNRFKLIYLPRLKMLKPAKTPAEKEKEKALMGGTTGPQKKDFEKRRKKEEEGRWFPEQGDVPGVWMARVPNNPSGYLGWLRPAWEDTMIELRSLLARMPFCGSRFTRSGNVDNGKETAQSLHGDISEGVPKKPKTLFEQDLQMLWALGLDATVYILFLRLLKYLFSAISILAILLAIANYYINTQTSFGSTSSLTLDSGNSTTTSSSGSSDGSTSNTTSILANPQLLTAANVTSNGLIVHIAFELIVTLLVIVFVARSSGHHLKLVQEWTHMNYNEVSFKTLMITNLSIRPNRAKDITTIADAKREIRSLVLGPDRDKIDSTVWFAIHNMNPLYEKMEEFKKKSFNWAIDAVAMETFYGSGKGVSYDGCKGRMCGMSKSAGSRVDEALKAKQEIEAMQAEIKKGQMDVKYTLLKGTVTSAFLTVPTAKQAREILKNSKDVLKEAGYHIQRAPRSHNVMWKNLELDAKSRASHEAIGKTALVIICFFNTIPLMIVTFLANLNTAVSLVPQLAKLEPTSDIGKAIFTVIAGLLPATISALFSYLLPYIMRRLAKWSGALTRSQLDRSVIRQLFAFQLVSNFIVFSLLGVIYETFLTISEDIGKENWSTIYASLGDLPAKITRAYITESLYWLSWYPIRAVVVWLNLLQLPRVILKVPALLTFKTPHGLADVVQPENFEFAIEYSHILFALVVGLMYAPLAPVVVICATIYFWSAYIVHSNQLRYVEDSKETDGKCWEIIINRLLVATVMMQLLMFLTVTLKTRSAPMAVGSALPILLLFLFKMYLSKHCHPDGELFSQYIDKYEDDERYLGSKGGEAPEYEHELLREDWMPKVKTVKNEKLMAAAVKRFPQFVDLLHVGKGNGAGKTKGGKKKRRKKKD